MHAQIQIFFVREEREGWGGVQAQRRENSLDFFLCLFWGFLVQNFLGGMGVQLFTRGGGVQMLISIEFDRTCDLPGMGVRTPYPPPPSGSAHA